MSFLDRLFGTSDNTSFVESFQRSGHMSTPDMSSIHERDNVPAKRYSRLTPGRSGDSTRIPLNGRRLDDEQMETLSGYVGDGVTDARTSGGRLHVFFNRKIDDESFEVDRDYQKNGNRLTIY